MQASSRPRRTLAQWLVSERVVVSMILLNAVSLVAIATVGVHHRSFWAWELVDVVCVGFFVIEALLKIRSKGFRSYWHSGWNRFDFVVVLVSLPALAAPLVHVSGLVHFRDVLVLRLGRLFRLFRLMHFIPDRHRLAAGIRRALRASIGVFLALVLLNLILAVAGMVLFGEEGRAPEHFGSPGRAAWTMFQIFTVEGWNEIVHEVEDDDTPVDVVVQLRVFLGIAVLVGGILGLSLANAVFVDEMTMDNTRDLEVRLDRLTEELRRLREDLRDR